MSLALEAQPLFSRVVFASCPTGTYCREDRCQSFFQFSLIPSVRAPLEECEAAGAVRDAGAKAWVIDAPAARMRDLEFLDRLVHLRPDLIVLATTFGSLDADLRWAERIKAAIPNSPIGLRGAPCYVWDEAILMRNQSVDFCMRGDYELVLSDLLRVGIEQAAGVSCRAAGQFMRSATLPRAVDLDRLPFPDRSTLDSSLYRVRGFGGVQATVHVQRGCPYPCTYCLVHTVSGNRARHRSPESIVAEVQSILNSGIRSFYLRAETFSLDREWALAVCRALRQRCPEIRWVTTTRIEKVDDELLGEMRASGCYGVSFGMDVASPEIAKHVRKLADPELARAVMRLCDKHRILSLGYLMTGFIWDTHETLKDTAKFIEYVRPDLITIHFAHPYPGTVYYENFLREGKSVVSPRAQAEPAQDTATVNRAALEYHARGLLLRHYSRPAVLLSLVKKGLAHVFDNSRTSKRTVDVAAIAVRASSKA